MTVSEFEFKAFRKNYKILKTTCTWEKKLKNFSNVPKLRAKSLQNKSTFTYMRKLVEKKCVEAKVICEIVEKNV